MPDTLNVHIKLTIEGSEIEAAVPVPVTPAPRRALLPILQQLTDTVVSLAEQAAAAQGQAISCKKGCDACCRQMVPISPTEAHALAALLNAMPAAQSAPILARFDDALDHLDQRGLLDRLLNRHTFTPDQLQQLDRDYFAASVACPFLDTKACSIHPDRPLACREFLVTSPARNCRNPAADRVSQLPLGAKVSTALAANDDHPWLPLTLARRFVAKHRERTPKDSPPQLLQKVLKSL